jgi:hypothetical protein
MARWSNATLVALGGFDKNVIIDELLLGEDNYYDITFLTDLQRTVSGVASNVITFSGGNNSPFQVDQYVSFGNNSDLFKIIAVGTNTITLYSTPSVGPLSGDAIQSPIDLSTSTFQFRLLEHTATINDDTRAGVDISNITPKAGATLLNLDTNIVTDVTGKSLTNGQIRAFINANDLVDNPIIDTTTPPFYTGYIGVTLPSYGTGTPQQVKKQRICFIVRADGTNS